MRFGQTPHLWLEAIRVGEQEFVVAGIPEHTKGNVAILTLEQAIGEAANHPSVCFLEEEVVSEIDQWGLLEFSKFLPHGGKAIFVTDRGVYAIEPHARFGWSMRVTLLDGDHLLYPQSDVLVFSLIPYKSPTMH